jgi:1,2-diacylglycerol 3-alpha-glucosyltransferase
MTEEITLAHPRKSVCLVTEDFVPAMTGVGFHVQCIAQQLLSLKYDVSIITTRQSHQSSREIWNGVSVFRVKTLKVMGYYQAIASAAKLKRLVQQIQPSIIHFHYLGFLLVRLRKIAKDLNIPSIYTYHMTVDHLAKNAMRPFKSMIGKKIVKYCNSTSRVIAVSKKLSTELQTELEVPVSFVSNPVVFEQAPSSPRLPERPSSFVILFAGRLEQEKNVEFLVKAFAKFLETQQDASLWIAGKGSLKAPLESLCARLGISPKVHFLGFVQHEQLASYYAACDLFVLPSFMETQGMVAMEAMWFSKPIIVTSSIVSAEELVDDGQNGYIVDPKSVDDLASKFAILQSDPELRQTMGQKGRERVETLTPEYVGRELDTIYTQVGGF